MDNPVDKIEQLIEGKMTKTHLQGVNDNTRLTNSVHKNFDTIFESMYHGSKETGFSTIDDERKRMGGDLKAMGKMSHSGAVEDVRKKNTRMGNIKDVQLDSD